MLSDCEITRILSHWFSESAYTVSKLPRGTSSCGYQVTTPTGKYILRRLASASAAEQEYNISQFLQITGISAPILRTQQGEPFFCGDYPYNLQVCLPGEPPNLSEKAPIISAANALATMQKYFNDAKFTVTTTDRFETMSLWKQASSQYTLLSDFLEPDCTTEDMQKHIQRIECSLFRDQIVHGDLGSWNMLWDGNRIAFIDFAECHFGDYYIDIAAVVASILRAESDQQKINENLDCFTSAYEQYYQPLNLAKLHNVLWLWLLRGAMAVCIYICESAKKESAIRKYHSDYEKYQRWTTHLKEVFR